MDSTIFYLSILLGPILFGFRAALRGVCPTMCLKCGKIFWDLRLCLLHVLSNLINIFDQTMAAVHQNTTFNELIENPKLFAVQPLFLNLQGKQCCVQLENKSSDQWIS